MRHRAAAIILVVSFGAALAAADVGRNSLAPLPARDWTEADAAHLLRRAGFGGTPDEVAALARLGVDAAVDSLVNYTQIAYDPPPPWIDPLILQPVSRDEIRQMNPEERERFQEQRRRAERRTFEETRLWWIERMVRSPRPLEEKMTLFWHGHFCSGMREVRNPLFMKEQNEMLRRHALDNFRELLLAVSRDRAMLVYLDGNRNVKRQPNENYGRELLELFTLGVGNYSESDIRAAARAFTGWTFDQEGFVFRRRDHDFDPKTFLGRTGNFDGGDIIDIIINHQACSRFLSRKLLEFFVRPDPDRALVEALARTIRDEKFQLRPVMRKLLRSRAFYHPASRGALVRSPVEVIVGTARQLGLQTADLFALERAMTAMGQELFQPPNVKGWTGGSRWINTATLFSRYNLAGSLIQGTLPSPGGRMRNAAARAESDPDDEPAMMMSGGGRPAQSRLSGGRQQPYDPMPLLRARELTSAEQVIDFFIAHLLARPLADDKREVLVDFLLGPERRFDLAASDAAARLRTLIHLIVSTPEYQMQ